MTILPIQAKVSKTAAFAGAGVDVSAITDDWTLKLQVESLTAEKKARFVVEDTVNDWTASLAGPTTNMLGGFDKTCDKVRSWKKADFPGLRIGVTGGAIKLSLSELDDGGTCVYKAWLEY